MPILDHLRVVLVAARNPLNIGAAARAMSNFGALHLRVVNPYSIAFREARSAVGAADLLARAKECSTLPDAVADCSLVVGTTAWQHRELQHPLHRLEHGGDLIRGALQSGRVAIVFGSEKRGLSNDDLTHCHWLMRIPTREAHSSMNLGQAVGVCLYELVREARSAPPAEKPLAASAALERITRLLLDSLQASGYVKPESEIANEEKGRRLVRRLGLSGEDAETLQGMLRKILWKLRLQK
ncbi:MAG TPA: TrmJ/YjtD family RNA methyltransferase [Terriglobales bacterium]|nr:TrmJ/YjtD family RNA methyltransferase [Terriglobales bacterium]